MRNLVFLMIAFTFFAIAKPKNANLTTSLVEDIKSFCKNKPRRFFCTSQMIIYAQDFQQEYEKIMKSTNCLLLHSKVI